MIPKQINNTKREEAVAPAAVEPSQPEPEKWAPPKNYRLFQTEAHFPKAVQLVLSCLYFSLVASGWRRDYDLLDALTAIYLVLTSILTWTIFLNGPFYRCNESGFHSLEMSMSIFILLSQFCFFAAAFLADICVFWQLIIPFNLLGVSYAAGTLAVWNALGEFTNAEEEEEEEGVKVQGREDFVERELNFKHLRESTAGVAKMIQLVVCCALALSCSSSIWLSRLPFAIIPILIHVFLILTSISLWSDVLIITVDRLLWTRKRILQIQFIFSGIAAAYFGTLSVLSTVYYWGFTWIFGLQAAVAYAAGFYITFVELAAARTCDNGASSLSDVVVSVDSPDEQVDKVSTRNQASLPCGTETKLCIANSSHCF